MSERAKRILILAVAVALALGVGAIVGGAVVYTVTHIGEEPVVTPVTLRQRVVHREPGVVVVSVEPESPAAEAGLVQGDVLLEIDGEALNDPSELVRYIQKLEPGDEVELTVLHGDEERTLTATVGERDGEPYLGLLASRDLAAELSVAMAEPGAVIVEVTPDSPAEEAGLRAGDVIVAVDGEELGEGCALGDLFAEHKPGDTVRLEIERPGEESKEVKVELGEHPEKEDEAYLGIRYRCVRNYGIMRWQGLPFVQPHRFGLEEWPFMFPGGHFERGAIVLSVSEDSAAEKAGLESGDVITAIDDEPVGSPQDLVDAVAGHEPDDDVTLTVFSADGEEKREVEVTLAKHPEEDGKAYLGVEIGGFFRAWRSQGREGLHGMQPFRKFFERFHDNWRLDPSNGLKFEWRPARPLDRFPFDLDFEFRLPPELFEEAPCCPGDSTA